MRKYEAGPDGRWGWIVCLGTFIVAFIVEGTTAAFGVLIIPIQEEFGATKSSTTWVASLSFGGCYLVGPVVSLFLDRYSLRQVTITGAVIGFIGFTAASFSPNIVFLIIAYGIVGGVSMGITFMTAIVAVGRYFNTKRAVATGIAMSGAGFGMFAYPFFAEKILQVFNWRGTILIMAAVYLHCAVSGAIFRPLTVLDVISQGKDETQQELNILPNKSIINGKEKLETNSIHVYRSLPQMNVLSKDDITTKSYSTECIRQGVSNTTLSNGLSRKDIYSSGFVQITCEQNHVLHRRSDHNNSENHRGCINWSKYKDNVQVLTNPTFIVVLFVMIFWSAQYICTLYIPDFAFSQGISGSKSALLVSFIGVTNTVGRIATGVIVDFFHIKSITLYQIAFGVNTIGTFLLPLCNTFWLIALYSIVSGFCVGTFTSMRSIIIVDFVGIDFLSHAYGWVSFFQGLSSIPAPPLAGFIYDESGSYANTFFLVASYYLCGTVTCCILRLINKCTKPSRNIAIEQLALQE